MNVSASHTATQIPMTPQKVGESLSPKLHVSSSIEITQPTASGSISPDIKNAVDTTYEKPVSPSADIDEPDTSVNPDVNGADSVAPEDASENTQTKTVKPKQENNETYSEAELDQISALKSRDAEVSAHERAHSAVGGQHAGSPSYNYKTGPDGVKYAVSGEVSIDTSSVPGNPQATLQKAQQIKAAALAPMEPSGQDRKVAAKAEQMATEARSDILEANSSGESTVKHAHHESSAPEHFSGADNLSSNNQLDTATQRQMSERSFHINQLYQNSATISLPSTLDIQV